MVTADVIRGLTESLLAARYDNPKPIPELHMEMWNLCCSNDRKVAIAAPRNHAKSSAITFAYVLAMVLFKQAKHVLIISSTEEIANGFLGDIKTELLENEPLIELFQIQKFIKESESEIIVRFNDGDKFRIISKGAGQKMRGIKWDRKRPDLVVGDDLEDDEQVLTRDRREKFKRWFYGAVLPIGNHTQAKFRLVGTVVHMDSLLEGFMPKPKLPTTVVTPLKVYSLDKNRAWTSVKYRAHPSMEDFSQILWPEQCDEEYLRAQQKDYKERGILDVYGQEFLNDPVDDSVAYFKMDDFQFSPMYDEKWKERRKTFYAAIDFAISQSQTADYSVIAVVSIDSEGRAEVEHVRKGRWDSLDIMENMFEVNNRYHPEQFFAEDGAIKKSIGPFLYSEMRQRGIYIPIVTLVPTKDKQARARPLQSRMRAGGVWFKESPDWTDDLVEEMRRFPKAIHDDQVDALSWIFLALSSLESPMTDAEIEEQELEEALSYRNVYGRDEYTGY